MAHKIDTFDPENFDTIGKLLRYLRQRAHLTQRELAAQVDFHYSYIKTATLTELENSPSIQLFIQRARAVQPEFKLTKESASAALEIATSQLTAATLLN